MSPPAPPPAEVLLVLVTTPSAEAAAQLARTLVEEGLAACGNVLPALRSIYRWEGRVCEEAEALLLLKAPASGFEALRSRVLQLHPYQVPEVVGVPLAAGHAPYLAWVVESTRPGAGSVG